MSNSTASRHSLADKLNESQCQIAFICDAFSQDKSDTFRFSVDGLTGLHSILRAIETNIEDVINEL